MTLIPIAEHLAVELSLPVFTWVCRGWDSNTKTSACAANALTQFQIFNFFPPLLNIFSKLKLRVFHQNIAWFFPPYSYWTILYLSIFIVINVHGNFMILQKISAEIIKYINAYSSQLVAKINSFEDFKD